MFQKLLIIAGQVTKKLMRFSFLPVGDTQAMRLEKV